MDANQLTLPGIDPNDVPRTTAQFDADNAPVECDTCGAECACADAIHLGSAAHCPACVHSCDRCNYQTVDSGELHTAYARGDLPSHSFRQGTGDCCEGCCWRCADCREYFVDRVERFQNLDGNDICEHCANEYCSCESCDTMISINETYSHDDRTLCQECYEAEREDSDDENEDTVIHSHWHKPKPVFFSVPGEQCDKGATIPFFGVEFEVVKEFADTDSHGDSAKSAGLHPNPFYHCEEDSSLTDAGFEIVSKPGTWAHWQTVDLAWMDTLRRKGYRSYDVPESMRSITCGQHIHVSRAFLGEEGVFTLLAFFKHNAAVMRALSRRDGKFGFCRFKPLTSSSAATMVLKSKNCGNAGASRYVAINLENKHTVEFRLFRGTLCPKGFRRNLSLVVALVHFAKWAQFGRHSWLDVGFFAQWCRTKGRKVLGAVGARILSDWIEDAIKGTVTADIAA